MSKRATFDYLRPDDWPTPIRRFLDEGANSGDPFAPKSQTAIWRPGTHKMRVSGMGCFLGWLVTCGRLRPDLGLEAYMTRDTMRAFCEQLRSQVLSTRTVANYIDGVRAALSVLSPETPSDWLMSAINQLRSMRSDRRRTAQRAQHTETLVTLGMQLMRDAVRERGQVNDYGRALKGRDGMIIVFGALCVPRLFPFHVMEIGRHLIRCTGGHTVRWSGTNMKSGRADEAKLGPELSKLLDCYIDEFRPVLAARGRRVGRPVPNELWLSRYGTPLSYRGLHGCIVSRTKAAFGVSVFPHAFRHGACTTLALERPELIEIVTPLLQHRSIRSREPYDLSTSLQASARFGAALDEQRFGRGPGRRLLREIGRRSAR